MRRILICDDSVEDIERIQLVLKPFQETYAFEVDSLSDLSSLPEKVQASAYDLLLLDLEFTKQDTNAVLFLEKLPPSLPVVIVSHLDHYQRKFRSTINVKAFVSKGDLRKSLTDTIHWMFSPVTKSLFEEKFTFPAFNSSAVPETVTVRNIRYIQMIKRGVFEIHYSDVDGSPLPTHHIRSKPFYVICQALTEQHVEGLIPISQNVLINMHMIKDITYLENGRLELFLFNCKESFSVGEKYSKYLLNTLTIRRTPDSYRWRKE